MLRSYKYRIYPNESQKVLINKTIDCCRFIFNLALEVKILSWRDGGVNLSYFNLCHQFTDLKKDYNWLNEVDSQALRASIKKVDTSFLNLYRGCGFPKFKNKRNSGSFQCPSNTRRINWNKSTLTVPKIYDIPIVLSRKFSGKIKTITISRTPTWKYFASVLVETNDILPPLPKINNAIGIDLGLTTFATLSTGEKINNPNYLKLNSYRLKILQRRSSKKKLGGSNRKRANIKVALLCEKITNQRNNFLNKISTKLVRDSQSDTICVENLAIVNMMKNHKIAASITDASWAEFLRQLEYKGRWYGKNIIKINRWYASSKTCSACGIKYGKLSMSERKWTCANCGKQHDRDINAAINIMKSGMGSPEEPVEMCSMEQSAKQESMPRHRSIVGNRN